MIFFNFLLRVVIYYEQCIFIIYDPAGKEINNFKQPKLTENSFIQIIHMVPISLFLQIKSPTRI